MSSSKKLQIYIRFGMIPAKCLFYFLVRDLEWEIYLSSNIDFFMIEVILSNDIRLTFSLVLVKLNLRLPATTPSRPRWEWHPVWSVSSILELGIVNQQRLMCNFSAIWANGDCTSDPQCLQGSPTWGPRSAWSPNLRSGMKASSTPSTPRCPRSPWPKVRNKFCSEFRTN